MQIKGFEQVIFAGTVLTTLLVAGIYLRDFLSQQLFNLVLAVLTIPFVLPSGGRGKGGFRFAGVALCIMGLSFYMPVSTFVYLSLVATLLFATESRFGRVNFQVIVVILLSMPLSTYLVDIFGFPIRLQLTSICGYIFRLGGFPIETVGNTFSYEGNDFVVDPACMGLNMLISSFLIGMLLLGFYQKRYGRRVSPLVLMLYLAGILLLNIFSNLIRIMVLVLFRIYPDTFMHDAVGLLCFLIQIMLPAWGICRFLARSCSRPVEGETTTKPAPHSTPALLRKGLVHLVCCGLLWVAATRVAEKKKLPPIVTTSVVLSGYTATPHSPDVVKLENDFSLVYIKQIRWFCDIDHHPTLCWGGSGYRFFRVQEATLNETRVYTAILQKNNDTLYTAWWYSNGEGTTNSQFQWRKEMLFGAPAYSLLNVTTSDKNRLSDEVKKLAELFMKRPCPTNIAE